MNSMTIQVTQEDIDEGKQANSYDCAVARAIKRQYQIEDLSVSSLSITVHGLRYKTEPDLAVFVHDFDRHKSFVIPAEFFIDLSTPISHHEPTGIYALSSKELVCA